MPLLGQGSQAIQGLDIASAGIEDATVAEVGAREFIGPRIGLSGYTVEEFRDAVFQQYQRLYDQADMIAQRQVAAGLLPNDPMVIGARVDFIARNGLRSWLFTAEGIQEGPGSVIQVNRWLRDPLGSGAYRIPDVRIPSANISFDGTIGWKSVTTPQIAQIRAFSGDNIVIIRPTRLVFP